MAPLQGHFLIATTELKDPNFFRTVVLLIRHSEEGAFGVVLNRASDTRVKAVWDKVRETHCASQENLRLGGPVQGPLMAVHSERDLSEIEIDDGIYFTANPDNLEELVAKSDTHARYFVGYAGWGAGQLENELAEGSWQTAKASTDVLFGDADDLWSEVRKQVARSSMLSALKIRHAPNDPSLN